MCKYFRLLIIRQCLFQQTCVYIVQRIISLSSLVENKKLPQHPFNIFYPCFTIINLISSSNELYIPVMMKFISLKINTVPMVYLLIKLVRQPLEMAIGLHRQINVIHNHDQLVAILQVILDV